LRNKKKESTGLTPEHQISKSEENEKRWMVKQPTILSISVRGTGVTPEHQISKSEDKRRDGWLNQPTIPRIVQGAGVTPEHQI
jgi:hypothetical protein